MPVLSLCADVKFLADQGQLVTAGADKTVRLWTAAEGGDEYSAAAVLKEHTGEVRTVSRRA
jgi:WD40 repeat protein